MHRALFSAAAAAAAALALLAAGPAGAVSSPPGGDVAYQVEISANLIGPQAYGTWAGQAQVGGGVWLWLELDTNHQGIYDGSDCGRGGAVSDSGTLTWQQVGDQLVVSGVALNGLPPFAQGDIVVPAAFGHATEPMVDVLTGMATFFGVLGIPPAGWAQVEVAP